MKFIYSSFPVLFIFPGILRINELPQASVLKRKAKCKAIDIKMLFYFHANKLKLSQEGFCTWILNVRVFGFGNGLLRKHLSHQYGIFGPETQTVPFELSSAVDYGQPV